MIGYHDFYIVGDLGHCLICDSKTMRVDLSFETHICSKSCWDQAWREISEECGKQGDRIVEPQNISEWLSDSLQDLLPPDST